MPLTPVLTARLAMLATVAALVLVIATDASYKSVFVAALVVAAVLGAGCCLALARHRPRTVAVLAAVSCLGIAGPVVYLRSLPDDSAAIPLGAVGGLFLSLVVLLVTFCLLPGHRSAAPTTSRG